MPDELYNFNEGSYEEFAKNGVSPSSVFHVLYGPGPRLRRHYGSVLNVAAQDQAGDWVAVGMLEGGDDTYVVMTARYLDEDEAWIVGHILREG